MKRVKGSAMEELEKGSKIHLHARRWHQIPSQMVVRNPMWFLGIELRTSARAVSALNH
jgi:hypothetical protein